MNSLPVKLKGMSTNQLRASLLLIQKLLDSILWR